MVSFIDDHRAAYGVEPICRVLPIAPSTYYALKARQADALRLPRRLVQTVAPAPPRQSSKAIITFADTSVSRASSSASMKRSSGRRWLISGATSSAGSESIAITSGNSRG